MSDDKQKILTFGDIWNPIQQKYERHPDSNQYAGPELYDAPVFPADNRISDRHGKFQIYSNLVDATVAIPVDLGVITFEWFDFFNTNEFTASHSYRWIGNHPKVDHRQNEWWRAVWSDPAERKPFERYYSAYYYPTEGFWEAWVLNYSEPRDFRDAAIRKVNSSGLEATYWQQWDEGPRKESYIGSWDYDEEDEGKWKFPEVSFLDSDPEDPDSEPISCTVPEFTLMGKMLDEWGRTDEETVLGNYYGTDGYRLI